MFKEKLNGTELKPKFLTLNREVQKSALEAIIFASDEPLSVNTLFNLLLFEANFYENNNSSQLTVESEIEEKYSFFKEEIENLIDELNQDLMLTGRAFQIVNFAGGFQYATRNEYGKYIELLGKIKTKRRFSQAALEVLAIIAYKQPVTKPQIEHIRGVNSNEVVNSLIEKELVRISGRSDSPGKPLLFSTTDEFLKIFGLHSLKELPKLKELEEFENTDFIDSVQDMTIDVSDNSENVNNSNADYTDESEVLNDLVQLENEKNITNNQN